MDDRKDHPLEKLVYAFAEFCGSISAILIIAKLAGFVGFPWLVVLLPAMIPLIVVLLVCGVLGFLFAVL